MTPLDKIKNLLINDGSPNQALVDYEIDRIVDDMVEKQLDREVGKGNKSKTKDSYYEDAHIDENKTIDINNVVLLYSKQKDFYKMVDMVHCSLSRYSPYISLTKISEPPEITKDSTLSENEKLIAMGFWLTLLITPKMKKSAFLYNKLDDNLEIKKDIGRKSKI